MAPIVITVRKRHPEAVTAVEHQPYECKALSVMDGRKCHFSYLPLIHFYRHNPSMERIDPVTVIREALRKSLVYYYPMAGRLKQGKEEEDQLMVECNGEGALFVEAEADVSLEQLGDRLLPPFSYTGEFFHGVPASENMLGCPFLVIQVTRLTCGGFIVGSNISHNISDGFGMAQFLKAVGEIARGANVPSILPVWDRHLINPRDPPRVTSTHPEVIGIADPSVPLVAKNDAVFKTFFFGPTELSTLRESISPSLQACTTFDLLTAFLWRCHTIALQLPMHEKVRFAFAVNARPKFDPPLPEGFYGNAYAIGVAVSSVCDLCEKPLEYALQLVKQAKEKMTDEHMRSFVDMVAKSKGASIPMEQTYWVSDLRNLGFEHVDFGWGMPVYGGPAKLMVSEIEVDNYFINFRNEKGEKGIIVPTYLNAKGMVRLAMEFERELNPTQISEEEKAHAIYI